MKKANMSMTTVAAAVLIIVGIIVLVVIFTGTSRDTVTQVTNCNGICAGSAKDCPPDLPYPRMNTNCEEICCTEFG